jgi:hypothetical protein
VTAGRIGSLLPYLPAAMVLAYVTALNSPVNDKFQFWYAGHLVASGASPFDPAQWAGLSRFGPLAVLTAFNCAVPDGASCLWIYPPWTAWLMVPIGALPSDLGIAAFTIAQAVVMLVAFVTLTREAGIRGPSRLVLTLGAALSAPVVWNQLLGQIGALELAGGVLVARGLRTRGPTSFISGAVLLSIKAHLFLALIPLAVALLVRWRAWRLLTASAISLGALILAGALLEPGWLMALGRAGQKGAGLVLPTVWSFADRVTPSLAPLTVAVVFALGIAATVVAFRAAPRDAWPLVFVSGAIGLSLLVAPYAHLYDHIMLLLAVAAIVVVTREERRYAAWSVVLGFVLLTWYAYLLGPHGDEPPFTALIPLVVLGALAVTLWARPRSP